VFYEGGSLTQTGKRTTPARSRSSTHESGKDLSDRELESSSTSLESTRKR